jgi:hypothetical protein
MKYFRTTGNQTKDLERIAGEMINISLCSTYYEDGILLDNPKLSHNSYLIDSVEYEIHPNCGLVIFRVPDNSYMHTLIEPKFREMMVKLGNKFGMKKAGTGISGTTQYMMIENKTAALGHVDIQIVGGAGRRFFENFPASANFIWCIVENDDASEHLPVAGYSHKNFPQVEKLLSLSSIIYDANDTFNLPDGDRSPDFPSITSYNSYKKGLIFDKKITYSANVGLTVEIAKIYGIANYTKYIENKCYELPLTVVSRPIRYVKWKNIRPHTSFEGALSWIEQINKGSLDEDINCETDDDIRLQKKSEKNEIQRCYITGCPIYEDCYVFDIYERKIIEYIPAADIKKYPDATIIVDEPLENKTAPESDNTTRGRGRGRGISRKKRGASTVVPAVKKPVIRRGAKGPAPNLIKISRVIEYDTPRCILVSPFYVHCASYDDQISEFENKTNTKVLVYRTFSPTTLEAVINASNASELHKKILNSINCGCKTLNRGILETSIAECHNDHFKSATLLHGNNRNKVFACISSNNVMHY